MCPSSESPSEELSAVLLSGVIRDNDTATAVPQCRGAGACWHQAHVGSPCLILVGFIVQRICKLISAAATHSPW